MPWVTTGRVDSPRKSIRASSAFRNGGWPNAYKAGFIEGLADAQVTDIPLVSATDFTVYTSTGLRGEDDGSGLGETDAGERRDQFPDAKVAGRPQRGLTAS